MLFADDTTVVGTKGEMDESVRRVKEVMGRWEERNNEDKEEVLEFGTEEGDEVRILGSWMGEKEDVRNRIRRAGMLWGNARGSLKGSRLSKRWQGRIVHVWKVVCCRQARVCVESSYYVGVIGMVNPCDRWRRDM